MKTIVKMLDLKFDGGFERTILAKGKVPPTNNIFKVRNSSPSPNKRRPATKRSAVSSDSHSPAKRNKNDTNLVAMTDNMLASLRDNIAPTSPDKDEPAVPVVVDATERMNLHISMTLELSNAAAGKSIPCKIPGCKSLVSKIDCLLYILRLILVYSR